MLRFVVPFVAALVLAPGAAATIPPSRDPAGSVLI
jgi:hypothetical protein